MKKNNNTVLKHKLIGKAFQNEEWCFSFFDIFSPSRDIQFFLLCKLGTDDVTSCEV